MGEPDSGGAAPSNRTDDFRARREPVGSAEELHKIPSAAAGWHSYQLEQLTPAQARTSEQFRTAPRIVPQANKLVVRGGAGIFDDRARPARS